MMIGSKPVLADHLILPYSPQSTTTFFIVFDPSLVPVLVRRRGRPHPRSIAMDLRRRAVDLLILISLLSLQSRADAGRSVVFFEGNQKFIRNNMLAMPGEASSMSLDEVAATVSVLLGFAPPASLHADSSSKLNEVLIPDPFNRPRAVFVLEVLGVEHPFLSIEYSDSKVESTYASRVIGSTKADMQLPDESEVSVVPLDEQLDVDCDAACAIKELGELARFLGGSYIGNMDSLEGELKLPLDRGASLSLHMSKKADQHFAVSLVSLVRNIKKASEIHEDFDGSSVNPAEIVTGRFTGIEALKEEYGPGDIAHKGEELFQRILTMSFELLQKSYKGQIVGVVLSTSKPDSDSEPMLDVKLSTRVSRLLEEDPVVKIIEVLLVRRVLAWITAIILLISTLIGVYFLLNMPLTRDTLLYSNVKLD